MIDSRNIATDIDVDQEEAQECSNLSQKRSNNNTNIASDDNAISLED